MKKMQTGWGPARSLEIALKASPLSNPELASAASINYHAIRRMRRYGVKNRSPNAIALCKFFGISESTRELGVTKRVLASAAMEAWDGTEEHGRLLLDVIERLGRITVVGK